VLGPHRRAIGTDRAGAAVADIRFVVASDRCNCTAKSFQSATKLESPDQTVASIGRQGAFVPGFDRPDFSV